MHIKAEGYWSSPRTLFIILKEVIGKSGAKLCDAAFFLEFYIARSVYLIT